MMRKKLLIYMTSYLCLHLAVPVWLVQAQKTYVNCYQCSTIDCADIDHIFNQNNDLNAWKRGNGSLPCSNTSTPKSNECIVCYSEINQEVNIVCDPEINPAIEIQGKGKALTNIPITSCPILAGGESEGQTMSRVNFTTSSPADTGSLSNDVNIAVRIGVTLGVISVIVVFILI
ncbi:hypothetical protein UPYG_G00156070 [Umbra pygmaea]|uniref:Uncharacterized protein n=1 Tax=Umbra pygmaea TaxID=75934 RepID=A0ABD0XKT9_UMBPY